MPDELKPVLAREMEVYAAFLEHTDHHVGRVVDAVEDLGVLDDTIIYYIIGDNGASAEGTMNGAFNEMANFNGMAALETPEFMRSRMDEFGSPSSYNHYSVGWAWAMNAPFQWTKQVASHSGGTRNGTIVHWPDGISDGGGLRDQFTHVIDIAPTILEAAKYDVLPLDDRSGERVDPELAGRPTLVNGDSQLFFPGMGRLSENSVVSIKNKSFSVTAEVEVAGRGANGVIIAQGGRFGGWALYCKDGRLRFAYNLLGIEAFTTVADAPVPAGTHQVRMEFAYEGGGLGKGGEVTLYHDGTAGGHGQVGATHAMIFSADETTDIGYESGTTVSPDYDAGTSRFTGTIHWVQLDVGKDDHDHFIDPEERFRIAMARQ